MSIIDDEYDDQKGRYISYACANFAFEVGKMVRETEDSYEALENVCSGKKNVLLEDIFLNGLKFGLGMEDVRRDSHKAFALGNDFAKKETDFAEKLLLEKPEIVKHSFLEGVKWIVFAKENCYDFCTVGLEKIRELGKKYACLDSGAALKVEADSLSTKNYEDLAESREMLEIFKKLEKKMNINITQDSIFSSGYYNSSASLAEVLEKKYFKAVYSEAFDCGIDFCLRYNEDHSRREEALNAFKKGLLDEEISGDEGLSSFRSAKYFDSKMEEDGDERRRILDLFFKGYHFARTFERGGLPFPNSGGLSLYAERSYIFGVEQYSKHLKNCEFFGFCIMHNSALNCLLC